MPQVRRDDLLQRAQAIAAQRTAKTQVHQNLAAQRTARTLAEQARRQREQNQPPRQSSNDPVRGTQRPGPQMWQTADHPRSRGEHVRITNVADVNIGSPPLGRGTHFVGEDGGEVLRITPARAGSTRRCARRPSR